MKDKSPKTTWAGLFAIIFSILGLVQVGLTRPADLADPTKIAVGISGITAGIGLIKAKDHDAS